MIAQFAAAPPPPRTHSPKGPILRFTFPCVCLSVSLVPQQGELLITTEFGKMMVEPNEICVIQVRLMAGLARVRLFLARRRPHFQKKKELK